MTSFPIDPTAPRIFVDTSVIIAGVGSRVGASAKRPKPCPATAMYRLISPELVPDPTLEQVRMWIGVIVAKDAPVLAAAVNARPHRLVTLDTNDFIEPPQVAAQSGLRICTPGDLLREIRGILARGFEEE